MQEIGNDKSIQLTCYYNDFPSFLLTSYRSTNTWGILYSIWVTFRHIDLFFPLLKSKTFLCLYIPLIFFLISFCCSSSCKNSGCHLCEILRGSEKEKEIENSIEDTVNIFPPFEEQRFLIILN